MTRNLVVLGTVLIVVGVGAAIWLRMRTTRRSQDAGFKEYVRDPDQPRQKAKIRREQEQAVADLSTESPEHLVRMLLDDELLPVARPAIRQAGSAIVPHLVMALSDPVYRTPVDEKMKAHVHILFRRSAPIITVLDCLEDYAPRSAVASVAPLVSDPDEDIRKHAALLLGMIASDDAVEPLRQALADEDGNVGDYALMGLLRAKQSNADMSPAFRRTMFDAILPLVWRDDPTVSGRAPRCLLALDREIAIAVLTEPQVFSPGREGLTYVLQALREAEARVASQPLVDLIQALEPISNQYPNDHVTAEALRLLGVAGATSEVVDATIRRGLDSQSRKVREGAATALAAAKGLTAPYAVVSERLEQTNWNALTAPQRHVLAVRILIDEVNNGGFEQYFVNSSGDHWPDALAGLEAIGALKTLGLVQQAISRFGQAGPSTDREKRHRQLAKVVKSDVEFFSPIEETFYKKQEDREVLLLRYFITYESDFR